MEVPYGLAALGEEREATMPKVVESDGREACSLEQRFEVAVHDVLGVQRPAFPGRDDKPLVVVGRGYQLLP